MISVYSNRKYGKGIELSLFLLIELLSSINALTEKLNAVFLMRIKVLVVLLYYGFVSNNMYKIGRHMPRNKPSMYSSISRLIKLILGIA
jgi:sorbitol-specific phosphotransferase system component IIC